MDRHGTRFGQRSGGYTRVVSELVKRAAEGAKRREERLKAIQQGKDEGEAPEE